MQSLFLLEKQGQRHVTRAMKHYREKKMVRNEQNQMMNSGMNERTLLLQHAKAEMI
jgi:hypothetical protein